MRRRYILILSFVLISTTGISQTFTDVTSGTGLTTARARYWHAIDIDKDNYQDIVYTQDGDYTNRKLMRNNGDGSFTDISVSTKFPASANHYADFNNDGWYDFFEFIDNGTSDSLKIHYFDGIVFNSETYPLGRDVTQTGGFLAQGRFQLYDWNGNGLMDLVCSVDQSGDIVIGVFINQIQNCGNEFNNFQLLVSGLGNTNNFFLVDIDNDFDSDIFVVDYASNPNGSFTTFPSRLFENINNTSFTEITSGSGLTSANGRMVGPWDYDNDGFLDLLVGIPDVIFNDTYEVKVFHNNGDKTFTDVSSSVILYGGSKYRAWGDIIDFDNDMDWDVMWATTGSSNSTSELYKNNGGGVFVESAADYGLNVDQGGICCPQYLHQVPLWFDYDNDNDLDVGIANDNTNSWFFKNNLDINLNRSISIKLEGCESGFVPYGARIVVKNGSSEITHYLDGKYYEFSSDRIHIGVGSANVIDSVIVYWPKGTITKLANVPSNQILTIQENQNCNFILQDNVCSGLVGYYPFNGNANDESGNGNDGIANGGITLTADRYGNASSAYSFDGIDDDINVGDSDGLDLTTEFTLSAWINYNGGEPVIDGNRTILS